MTSLLINIIFSKKKKATRVICCCHFPTSVDPTLAPHVSRTLLVKCVSRGAQSCLFYFIIFIFFDNLTHPKLSLHLPRPHFFNRKPAFTVSLNSNTHLQSRTKKTEQAKLPVTHLPRVEARNKFNRRGSQIGDAGS